MCILHSLKYTVTPTECFILKDGQLNFSDGSGLILFVVIQLSIKTGKHAQQYASKVLSKIE